MKCKTLQLETDKLLKFSKKIILIELFTNIKALIYTASTNQLLTNYLLMLVCGVLLEK